MHRVAAHHQRPSSLQLCQKNIGSPVLSMQEMKLLEGPTGPDKGPGGLYLDGLKFIGDDYIKPMKLQTSTESTWVLV